MWPDRNPVWRDPRARRAVRRLLKRAGSDQRGRHGDRCRIFPAAAGSTLASSRETMSSDNTGSGERFDDGIVAAIGNTPLIALKRASEETGCLILGKAEFMNPGQSVKDRAALFIIEDAIAQGRPAARRHHRRGHRRQHRHRARAGRQRHGVSLRHRYPGHAEPGEEGHAAPMRRGTGRGAGGSLFQSQQLREVSGRLAAQLAESEPNGAIWANQFDNVANRNGHIAPPDRKSGSRRTARLTASSARSGPEARWRASRMALKERNPRHRSASPTRRARRSTATTRTAC